MLKIDGELTTVVISKKDLLELHITLKSFSNLNENYPKLILVLSEYLEQEIEGLLTKYRHLKPEIYVIESTGPYSAMNFGLEKTKTNFVNFLHGGDSYSDGSAIFELLQSMDDNLIGYGEIKIINSLNKKLKIYSFKKYSSTLHRLGLKYIPHPATIVSTKAAKDLGGFDISYSVAADQKMLLQLTMKKYPVILPKIVASFKLGGISSRSQNEIINDFRRISFEINGYFFSMRLFDSLLWNCNKIFRFIYKFILNIKDNFL